MARLVAMYKTPSDTAAFDAYYAENHMPLAKTIPGLTGYEVSSGPVVSPLAGPGGDSGYHLIATLHFESMPALQAALGSPEGQATAGDLANFADGGVELLVFDSKAV
ncbi:EthD family reductase [Acidimangrovimonas pyrenivorans]|uniref:EthD family reductase n=1 Tax=Acidimangrovimonas pyrenivorans TaxID=2030798 RepID=A0ABV7AD70_9RHOB